MYFEYRVKDLVMLHYLAFEYNSHDNYRLVYMSDFV